MSLAKPGYLAGVRIRSDHSLRRIHKVQLRHANGEVLMVRSGLDAVAFTIATHADVHLWFLRKGHLIEIALTENDTRLNGPIELTIEPALLEAKPQELKIYERRITIDEAGPSTRAYRVG